MNYRIGNSLAASLDGKLAEFLHRKHTRPTRYVGYNSTGQRAGKCTTYRIGEKVLELQIQTTDNPLRKLEKQATTAKGNVLRVATRPDATAASIEVSSRELARVEKALQAARLLRAVENLAIAVVLDVTDMNAINLAINTRVSALQIDSVPEQTRLQAELAKLQAELAALTGEVSDDAGSLTNQGAIGDAAS